MTVRDAILAELAKGPRTLTYLEGKCRRPGLPSGHVMKALAAMVSAKEVYVREWVVECGKFTPVYERRKRA